MSHDLREKNESAQMLRLKAGKPCSKAYPEKVVCLGDAMRKRRLDLRGKQRVTASKGSGLES